GAHGREGGLAGLGRFPLTVGLLRGFLGLAGGFLRPVLAFLPLPLFAALAVEALLLLAPGPLLAVQALPLQCGGVLALLAPGPLLAVEPFQLQPGGVLTLALAVGEFL